MRVAVKSLCEFAARRGDLDHRYTPSPTAREGIAGHGRVRKGRGPGYQSEYPLTGTCEGLQLVGRADGYDASEGYIEEIKTHRGALERLPEAQRALHWAQLKVYGALLCAARSLNAIELRLTYFDLDRERETTLTEQASAEQLRQTLRSLCRIYAAWAVREQAHRERRDRALAGLRFPFDDFRPGQRRLAEQAYRSVCTGQRLMLQAPTGIGKTLGTLFPALMAMARRPLDRLFYLTPRNTGRQLAVEGVLRIGRRQAGPLPLRVLVLASRDQTCEHPQLACHGESCPLARGFFDKLVAARETAVAENAILDEARLRVIALAHEICPYYLAQEMARWCDLVIGDVNRYFDQQAILHALTRQNSWRVGLLLDEAHNLVDRARGMYSATLQQQRLLALKRHAHPVLKRPFNRLARAWRDTLAKQDLNRIDAASREGERHLAELPAELLNAAHGAVAAITDFLSEHPADAELQQLLFELLGFLRLSELFADHSLCSLSLPRRGRGCLRISNMIPADFLAPRFHSADSCLLFSATLRPAVYHQQLLGLPDSLRWLEVDSPFQQRQLEVRLETGISTRLQHRQTSIEPIVQLIAGQFQRKPGNYLAYFSSFAYLGAIHERFQAAFPDIPSWRQQPGMSDQARSDFIERFSEEGAGVGFAVLGGAFAEGIDLPGRRLIGVFIATLGLPPFDPWHRELSERLQQRYGKGYDYTYLYPGLQKVSQAAGRVIRSASDTGVVVLIDDRYADPRVQQLLPGWWALPAPDRAPNP